MKTNYSLHALLKLRSHKKTMAENHLRNALETLELEKKKLETIEVCLEDTLNARTRLQHNFFLKARMSPCNKREISVHVSSREKNLFDEHSLRKSLALQEEQLRQAYSKLEIAKTDVLTTYRNLKVIEKHYTLWQQQQKQTEKIKEEYDNDDQNGMRFILKKA